MKSFLRDFLLTIISISLLFLGIFLYSDWSNKTVASSELYPFSPGDKTWILEVRYVDKSPLSFFMHRNVRILISPDEIDRWFNNYQDNLKLQVPKKSLMAKFSQKWKK